MKVKLRTLMAGPDGCHHPGDIIEVTAAQAEDLISNGYGEPVKEQSSEAKTNVSWLQSADAPSRLSGCSLSAAFKKSVLEDLEVAELAKKILQREPTHATIFRDGQFPGPFIDYKWPLDLTASNLAYQFVKPVLIILGEPLPKAPDDIKKVSEVIVDRLGALRAILIEGKIVARGTFVSTGVVGLIDPLQWARQNLWIEVRNGDLFEEEADKPVPRWTGLMLVARETVQSRRPSETSNRIAQAGSSSTAENTFHVEPSKNDGLRFSSVEPNVQKLTARQASIEAAILANWPSGIPPGLPPKVRDGKIIAWQKANGLAIASSKTIRRYLSAQRK